MEAHSNLKAKTVVISVQLVYGARETLLGVAKILAFDPRYFDSRLSALATVTIMFAMAKARAVSSAIARTARIASLG